MYTTKQVDGQTTIVPLEEGTEAFSIIGTRRPPVEYHTYVLHLGTGGLIPLMRAIRDHPDVNGIVVPARRDLRAPSAAFPDVAVFYITSLERVLQGTAMRISVALQDVLSSPAAFPVLESLLAPLRGGKNLVLMYRGQLPALHLIQHATCTPLTTDDLDRLLAIGERSGELTLSNPYKVLEAPALNIQRVSTAARSVGAEGIVVVHDSYKLSPEQYQHLYRVLTRARLDGARVILSVCMDEKGAPSVADVVAWADDDVYDLVSFDSDSPHYQLSPAFDKDEQFVGVASQESTGSGFDPGDMTRIVRTYPAELDPETEEPATWDVTRYFRGSLLSEDGTRVLLVSGNLKSGATLLKPTEARVRVDYADQTDGEQAAVLAAVISGDYVLALSGTSAEWIDLLEEDPMDAFKHPVLGPSLKAFSGSLSTFQAVMAWGYCDGIYAIQNGRVAWVVDRGTREVR